MTKTTTFIDGLRHSCGRTSWSLGGAFSDLRSNTTKSHSLKSLLVLAVALLMGTSAWGQTNLLAVDGVSFTCQDKGNSNAAVTITQNGDKSISYSCGNEIYLELTFSTGVSIDASKAYVVIEASDAYATTKKLRNIILDGTNYDQSNSANVSASTINGHSVLLMSPLGRTDNMFAKYVSAGDDEMSLTRVGFNLKPASGTEFTIYRIGFYDIAEIMSLYSNPALRFSSDLTSSLRLNFAGTANQVLVDNNTITMTRDESVVLLKSMGTLPNTCTLVSLRGLTLSDAASVKPFTKETMTNLSNVTKVLMSTTAYNFFPTVNQNVYVLGSRYYPYKDGVAPTTTYTGNGSTTNEGYRDGNSYRYFSYTRNFKEGYSTCILPFQLDVSETSSNLSFYTFTSNDNGTITFTKTTEDINCNTPFIVKATEAGLYMFYLLHDSETWNEGKASGTGQGYKYYETSASNGVKFVGTFLSEAPMGSGKDYESGYNCYGITSNGESFAPMTSTTIAQYYRAFLASSNASYAPARSLNFDNGDGTTNIISIKDVDGMNTGINDGVYYDLSGRRVLNPTKGLYIVNGKKVIVK